MSEYNVVSSSEADTADVATLHSGLDAYNDGHAGPARFRKVHLFVRDAAGTVRGGLVGRHVWRWLYIELLWVDESIRGNGLGTQLLVQAEREAVEAGCTRALLDTFDFQAPTFYRRRGYSVFAVLEDFPPGHLRYYLRKDLVADERSQRWLKTSKSVVVVAPETIATARLLLRRPKPSDASTVYEYTRDPEVTRYMDWPAPSNIGDTIAAGENALRRWESGDEYAWRITVKLDDSPVGAVGCRVNGHSADLGFWLARPFWGRGYATEAARAVLEWLASLDAVYRVWSTCDIENAASARVLERIGMSRECVLRRWAIRPNMPRQPPRDAFLYSWIREA